MRTHQKRYLEGKADRLLDKIVFMRDFQCVCGRIIDDCHRQDVQPNHIITPKKWRLRWDLRNKHCQCLLCRTLHKNGDEIYIQWFAREFGNAEYVKLIEDSSIIFNPMPSDMRTLCDELEKILAYQREHPNWRPYFRQMDILSGEWKKCLGEEQ